MRLNGAWTALISGGFDVFTNRIAEKLGFQENRANRLMETGGRLTGEVAEPILGRAAKGRGTGGNRRAAAASTRAMPSPSAMARTISTCCGSRAWAWRCTPSRPSPPRPGIRIHHGDLTALLYLQGYRQEEFVG